MCTKSSWSLVIAAVLAIGCSKPAATSAPAGPTSVGGEATPEAGATEGKQVVCTLDCSGTEAKGYGATEEEARADVRRHVAENCKPEDGQHFIFCEPQD
ncbi:MAG: hypothetical protein K8M05_41170 [Deltaproteobacteria bacterium]|nr:hypothetical protein [Kofleriaceae bacterium]